jgi:hypothetical protein
LVSLIQRTRQRWVTLSKTQRERVSETMQLLASRIAQARRSHNNVQGLDSADDEFIGSFEDESDETAAMWIPMEVLGERRTRSSASS